MPFGYTLKVGNQFDISGMLGRATAVPLATPGEIRSRPDTLARIGRVQDVHSVQVHYVHGVTDKQTN